MGEVGIFLFLYGGGFVMGDPGMYDVLCWFFVQYGLDVIFFDYWWVFEYFFLVFVEDCLVVVRYVLVGGLVVIGGDSVGGNFMVVVVVELVWVGEFFFIV